MDYLDFFNRYIMTGVQIFIGFHFYTKFLKKKVKPIGYLPFAILGTVIIQTIKAGNIVEFVLYVLLLSVSGLFLCKIHNISVVLYAVITVEIMQFMFGIFNSILSILYPLTITANLKLTGIIFMLLGYLALPTAIICYYIADKFFSYDETINSQYTLMFLTPTLMIFLIGEYINSTIYGNTIITNSSRKIIGANHYQMLIIQFLGIASLFCIMFSYKKLLENFRLNTKLSLLEQEEHSLSQYVMDVICCEL